MSTDDRNFYAFTVIFFFFEIWYWNLLAVTQSWYPNTEYHMTFWWNDVQPLWQARGLLNVSTCYPHLMNVLMYIVISLANGSFTLYLMIYYFLLDVFWVGRNILIYHTLKKIGNKNYLITTLILMCVWDWYGTGFIHHQLAWFLMALSIYLIVDKKLIWSSLSVALGSLTTLMCMPILLTILKAQKLEKAWKPLLVFFLTGLIICMPFMISNFPVFISGYIWQFTREPSMTIWGIISGSDVWGVPSIAFVEPIELPNLYTTFNFLLPLSTFFLLASFIFIKVKNQKELLLFNAFINTLYIFFVKILESRYYMLTLPFISESLEFIMLIGVASGIMDLMWRAYPTFYNPAIVTISGLIHISILLFLIWRLRKNIYVPLIRRRPADQRFNSLSNDRPEPR